MEKRGSKNRGGGRIDSYNMLTILVLWSFLRIFVQKFKNFENLQNSDERVPTRNFRWFGELRVKITEMPEISNGDPFIGILGVSEIFEILDENPYR